jgi:hypothetical protein
VATFKILYWQEIPSQIRADDGDDEVNLQLGRKFQDRIDELAVVRGLQDSDAYLAEWKWSGPQERSGSADVVAQAVKAELEARANW